MSLNKTAVFPSYFFCFAFSIFSLFLTSCSGGSSGRSNSNSNNNTEACTLDNGVGERVSSTSGEDGKCKLVRCNEGYTEDDGGCRVTEIACTYGDLAEEDANAAEGTRLYQKSINDYGDCTITSCNSSHILGNDGDCHAATLVCEDVEVAGVDVQGLAGTRPYQKATDDYGTCVLTSCKTSYTLGGAGQCYETRVDCIGQALTDIHASSATKTYDQNTDQYQACEASVCIGDYTLYSGVCYETNKACVGGELATLRSSDANIATVTKPYQRDTEGTYGACVPASCTTGYGLQSGACVDSQPCTPSELTSADVNAAKGIKPIQAGGNYGSCVVETCKGGYTLHAGTGTCYETNKTCTPGELTALDASTATKPYQVASNDYGVCVPSVCISSHTLDDGACHESSQACSGPELTPSCRYRHQTLPTA